ncbi:alpha/beta hydrolase [Streptacidiphilus cavernicola]|uniref:Alpha/beta hydrolase n=1 Tax=Streptacidiphilus cavernicola TaxID=3342716 RepID=A0ABV6VXP7_9ACTN
MDLTSSTLQYEAGGLTLAFVVATVWLWPRLARRGILPIAGRFMMIIASQLSLVLLVTLMLNSYGDFYPTWQDLTGGGSNTVTIGSGPGNRATQAGLSGSRLVLPADDSSLRQQPDLVHGPAAQVGQYSAVTIVGEHSGIQQQAYVYLPPEYFQPAFQHTAFPVLTTYVGYPGSIQGVMARLKLPQTAAKMMAAGQMRPTIVVLISQTVATPRDTDCVDVAGGPQVETYLTSDYQTAMRSAYRVRPEAAAWGLVGFSEGGTCALENAMRHPNEFGVAVSLGGDFRDTEDAQTGTLFGAKGTARDKLLDGYNLLWRLEHLPAPKIKVLVATTAHGERDYAPTEAFLHAVRPPMEATPMVLSNGGHNFTTWGIELTPSLTWMARQLLPPAQITTPPPTHKHTSAGPRPSGHGTQPPAKTDAWTPAQAAGPAGKP